MDGFVESKLVSNYGILKNVTEVKLFCNDRLSGVAFKRLNDQSQEVWIWGHLNNTHSVPNNLLKIVVPYQIAQEGGIRQVCCTSSQIFIMTHAGGLYSIKDCNQIQQVNLHHQVKVIATHTSKLAFVNKSN